MGTSVITCKSDRELALMDRANRIVKQVLAKLAAAARPGTSTDELDSLAESELARCGAAPAFKNYRGFPKVLCASVNEQVVHGIPSKRKLKEGDIVGLDFGAVVEGYYGDGAITVAVGTASSDRLALIEVTRRSLAIGIREMRDGARIGDIGQAIQHFVEAQGYSVVRDFVGHGIGTALHEEPTVPNYGSAGRGPLLRHGMVLAIEPMVNIGSAEVVTEPDGWTVRTRDGRPSAHFEHSVALTKNGPWILGLDAEAQAEELELASVVRV